MKSNKKKTIGILVLIILLGGLAYFILGKKESSKVILKTTKVSTKDITNSVTATGTVQPVDQVEVGTQVSGLVHKIYVDYNTQVHKGQLLAELDKTILQESVNNANAAYSAAQNEVHFYQQAYDRAQKMYQSEVISKAEYEQAAYQLNNARATVTQRKTALTQAQTNLGYANVYSPIDGVILSKEVEEGQTVAASMSTPTLFSIAKDITKMQVEANVDEADIGNVTVGQRVSFTVDAFPEATFNGVVKQVRLGATTTSNVVTYTVIVTADNPDQKLKPGLTATITIYTEERKGVPGLEAAAFAFTPDEQLLQKYYQQNDIKVALPQARKTAAKEKTVWVKNADGSLSQKVITTGVGDGITVEIVSGLTDQETVVSGMEEQSGKESKGKESGSSPFMPKRPGNQNQKASQRQPQ